MAEIILPRRIIANKCMPGGWRGLKKPKFIIPGGYSPGHISRFGPACHDEKRFQPVVIPGVLDNWEYRFWAIVVFNNRVVAECRCCGAEGGADTKERQEHFERGGCSRKLCRAYLLLIKDKVCVICDKVRMDKRKWGVPLCSPECEQAWCENEAQPKCLTAALMLVGENP